jgi:hypothetical protein
MIRTASILQEMRNANAEAIDAVNTELAARIADRAEHVKQTGIIGSATATGGTDRIPAERRSLTAQATTLTGIPLLDGIALLPDTAGSLLTAPEMISHATARRILPDATPESLAALLKQVNPAPCLPGRRPRRITTTNDDVRILTTPPARTSHGSLLHASFRSTDAEVRSLHGNGRQTPLTDYQAARIAVARRRVTRLFPPSTLPDSLAEIRREIWPVG